MKKCKEEIGFISSLSRAYSVSGRDYIVNRRSINRLSALFLALALFVRLSMQSGLDVLAREALSNALADPETAGILLYLELGQALPVPETVEQEPATGQVPETEVGQVPEPAIEQALEPAASPEEPKPLSLPNTVPKPLPEPETKLEAPPSTEEKEETEEKPKLVFTEADGESIELAGGCSYWVDKQGLLEKPSGLDFDQDGPSVLIVHTHTCEAYTQEAGWEYDPSDTARTQDPDYSVVRVGAELAETLESRGVKVVHDGSVNDYPSFNTAYWTALERIEELLARYPTIQMVIDVHRDAAADNDGFPISRTATVNGEELAQLMLVVGTDEGGLEHPNWRDNLSWALKLQAVLNRNWPGLCRPLDLRTERFNQHATRGSLLVEVGASGNTLRQAIRSARILGDALADLIEGT